MGSLTEDPAFLATTFVVIDFETTTPSGYPAQPIEVAALALRYQQRAWTRVGTSTSLIRPPAFAPVTPADIAQTGLAPEQLISAPTPTEALGALDRRFTPDAPYLLVAQHAATEANVIHNQREHCPTLARIDFIDTIPLARQIVPDLPNYKLDTLLAHFSISQRTATEPALMSRLRRRCSSTVMHCRSLSARVLTTSQLVIQPDHMLSIDWFADAWIKRYYGRSARVFR